MERRDGIALNYYHDQSPIRDGRRALQRSLDSLGGNWAVHVERSIRWLAYVGDVDWWDDCWNTNSSRNVRLYGAGAGLYHAYTADADTTAFDNDFAGCRPVCPTQRVKSQRRYQLAGSQVGQDITPVPVISRS